MSIVEVIALVVWELSSVGLWFVVSFIFYFLCSNMMCT